MGDVVALANRRPLPDFPSAGELPPHDFEAEQALVAAGMLVPLADTDDARTQRERLDRVHELVSPEMLYDPALGLIWKGLATLRASKTPIDAHTIASWLAERNALAKVGGTVRLHDLLDHAYEPRNVEAHAARVVDKWERREIIATCLRVQAEARGTVLDHEDAKAGWRRDLGRVTAPRLALEGRTIGAVAKAVRQRVSEGAQRIVGVRYGLRALEARFGLLARGRQHVLAGRSEHGKTALACQIAWSVANLWPPACGTCGGARSVDGGTCDACKGTGDQPPPEVGEAVYIMSGEMPAETLLFRSACSLAAVDPQAIELGVAGGNEIEAFGQWLGRLNALPIIIDDKPAPPAEIARRVRQWQALFAEGKARRERDGGERDGALFPKCRMQLVVGDHLQELAQLAPPLGPREDHLRQIAATAMGWRDHIAKGCQVATLLLSQLTRAVADPKAKKRWPVAADLWGGTPIESSADTIIGVQRPEILGGKVNEKWRDVAGVVPMKSRMGGSRRIVRVGFYRGMFFDELPAQARLLFDERDDDDDDD